MKGGKSCAANELRKISRRITYLCAETPNLGYFATKVRKVARRNREVIDAQIVTEIRSSQIARPSTGENLGTRIRRNARPLEDFCQSLCNFAWHCLKWPVFTVELVDTFAGFADWQIYLDFVHQSENAGHMLTAAETDLTFVE